MTRINQTQNKKWQLRVISFCLHTADVFCESLTLQQQYFTSHVNLRHRSYFYEKSHVTFWRSNCSPDTEREKKKTEKKCLFLHFSTTKETTWTEFL